MSYEQHNITRKYVSTSVTFSMSACPDPLSCQHHVRQALLTRKAQQSEWHFLDCSNSSKWSVIQWTVILDRKNLRNLVVQMDS